MLRFKIRVLLLVMILEIVIKMQNLLDNNLDILIFKRFLNQEQSDWLLSYCLNEVSWAQDEYNFRGKKVFSPRLTSLYGSKKYSYSGQTLNPKPFTKPLVKLEKLISNVAKSNYNVVLLNKYRNGEDSVSWHTDSEKSLGLNPNIASLSLGGSKPFKLREISNKKNQHEILLEHGDLIIMKSQTQHYWEHSIPKSKKFNKLRVNLTFRNII